MTPAVVEIGDVFNVICNGKTISVIATAATAANVVSLLAAAIGNTTIVEFQEFTAVANGGVLTLTANEAGVPFIVTASASNGGAAGVDVVTTTEGSPASAGVNAVVSFWIPSDGCGNTGTFTVYHQGHASSNIAVGASAATVQTALEAISSIGAGNVTVTLSTASPDGIQLAGECDTYTCTFAGALAGSYQTLLAFLNATRPVTRRTQRGTATLPSMIEIDFSMAALSFGDTGANLQTFTLTWNSYTGPSSGSLHMGNASISAIHLALINDLSGFGPSANFSEFWSVGTKRLPISYIGPLFGFDSYLVLANNVSGCSGTIALPVTIVTVGRGAVAAVNEVQVVTLTTAPTGGTFTLTLGANTTSAIAYNASAATVQTALQALASIGAGNVTLTGSAGGPWVLTFVSGKAGTDVGAIVGNGLALTGGTSQTLVAADIVPSAGPNHWDTPSNWTPSGVPVTGDAVVFEDTGADCLYGLDQSGVTLASLTVSLAWQNRKLGLPHINANGYREYREQQLTIGATVVTIGTQNGTGPSRVYLDTGTVQTALSIVNSGSSLDAFPCVVWIGDNVLNTIVQDGGEFGTSPFADVSSQFSSLTMYGGRCVLKNATVVDSVQCYGNQFRAFSCTLGGKMFEV